MTYFDILMLFPDEKELFYVISIDAIDVFAGFMQEVGPVPISDLSDPFATKKRAVWVAVDFQVSADEGGGIHP